MNIYDFLSNIKENIELKRVRNNFLSLSSLQILNMFLPLVLIPYLVRVLGLENFGLLIFAQSFVMYFTLLIDYGFNISATREISTHKEDYQYISKVFFSVFFIKFCLLILSSIIFILIVLSFQLFSEHSQLYFISFAILIGQLLFPTWYYQGIEDMKLIAILNFFIKVFSTISIVLFTNSSNDLLLVASLNSCSYIIIGFIAFYIAFRQLSLISIDYILIKKLFYDSSSIFISNFFSSLYSISNNFLLGIFTNNSFVGIYSSYEKIITALKSLYIPLYQALFPYVSRKVNKKSLIRKMIIPIAISGLVISILIYIFANYIIFLLYKNFNLIDNIYLFEIMALIPFFSSINMLFNFLYLNSMKLYIIRMKIMILAGVFNFIIASILLSLNYEILSVVISYTFTELILLILGYYIFRKKYESI